MKETFLARAIHLTTLIGYSIESHLPQASDKGLRIVLVQRHLVLVPLCAAQPKQKGFGSTQHSQTRVARLRLVWVGWILPILECSYLYADLPKDGLWMDQKTISCPYSTQESNMRWLYE